MLSALQPLLIPFLKVCGLVFLAWAVLQGLKLYCSLSEVK